MVALRLPFRRLGRLAPLIAQASIAVGALGTLLLSPPHEGQMTLLPLTDEAARALPGLALGDTGRLVARGPYEGALVVSGRRPDLASYLFEHSILVIGVPDAGCLGARNS